MVNEDVTRRLRESRVLTERVAAGSAEMRVNSEAQRRRLLDMRTTSERPSTEVLLQRLWPHLRAPVGVDVAIAPAAGDHPVLLLCGVCDEVLAVGTYAGDLRVALQCQACRAFNTSAHVAWRQQREADRRAADAGNVRAPGDPRADES